MEKSITDLLVHMYHMDKRILYRATLPRQCHINGIIRMRPSSDIHTHTGSGEGGARRNEHTAKFTATAETIYSHGKCHLIVYIIKKHYKNGIAALVLVLRHFGATAVPQPATVSVHVPNKPNQMPANNVFSVCVCL